MNNEVQFTYEEILKKYSDMVYKLALSRTKNTADAEDVFQEVSSNFTVCIIYDIIILKNFYYTRRKIYGFRPGTDEYNVSINFNSRFNVD